MSRFSRLGRLLGLHTLDGDHLVPILDAHDDDALDIPLVDVDGRGGDADDDAAVLDDHHVVIFPNYPAAGNPAGLGGDVIVLQALAAPALGQLLALGAGAQVLGQLGALAVAVFRDGEQGLALLGLLGADDQIPEAGRTARGTAMVNILPLEAGEAVTAMVVTREFHEDEYLVMVTSQGTVKRIPFIALKTNRKAGIRAITLDETDHLISVIRTNGDDNIILATAGGMAICFNENDVRPMGRDAAGVRGINLNQGDYVVGAEKAEEGKTLLTVTQNGYGKRTELSEYLRGGTNGEKQAQSRGGKGLKNYNITAKTGIVAGCRVVGEQDDVMIIENGGVIIRIPASSINIYKRDVQGVIVMRIDEGNQVVSLERVENMEEEEPQA